MFCVNDLTNLATIEVQADNGIYMSSAVYRDINGGVPSTTQFPFWSSDLGMELYQVFATVSTNTSGTQGNEGHVSGSIKTKSGVVYVDAYVKVLPGADNAYRVEGSTPVRDLNRAMDWALPDEEATTVAGLVIHEARSIPDRGQSFTFHGFRFRVLRRERNRITALRINAVPREAEVLEPRPKRAGTSF